MKEKYPIETLLALREQGLSYREIGKRTGLEHSGVRMRILKYQKHGGEPKTGRPKKREMDRSVVQYGEVTTYKLSPAEIEKRYGKPGEFAEPVSTAVTNGWPDMGERNKRHYARKEQYGLSSYVQR